jgi:orotidine-5'-phosphate decarboxylase
LAKKYGLDGVVASPREARLLRSNLGRDFIIVTPGIRLGKSVRSDQKRTATPAQAALSGSNYLVVGRPIIQAKDPLEVAKEIISQIKR